jgi:chromosomal replication initiator protein
MTAVARVMEDLSPFLSNVGSLPLPAVPSEAPFIEAQPAESPPAVPAELSPEDLLERIAENLRARIGLERYDLWFDRKTRLVLAGNALIVEANNAFAVRWISGKLAADLRAAAADILGRVVDLIVRLAEQPATAPLPPDTIPAIPAAHASRTPIPAAAPGTLLNPKYLLEEFVIGPSNQLAFHAAVRVAENPGKQFNPLFIHGHCGLGKSHLLQGICHRFAQKHPGKKWLYLTGEAFTNDFLEALRTHKTDAFRRRLRSADLLIIDDVHFLANKKATQEEFLHTFNQIDAAGKQIVLASDCAPRQIAALSEQLSSRFISGMVLRVDSPDLPTRLEILRRRVARNGWNIADPVLVHIAQTATSSVRELEGLLLQVVAGISLINTGAPEAGAVLATLRERTAMRGPIPAERIVACVAEHFALAESAILGGGREKLVSTARAVAMYLARQHTGMSFPEIGRAIGGKNHSTVIAACQRIEASLSGGDLVFWNTPTGPRQQALPDILHDLEAAIRRVR